MAVDAVGWLPGPLRYRLALGVVELDPSCLSGVRSAIDAYHVIMAGYPLLLDNRTMYKVRGGHP